MLLGAGNNKKHSPGCNNLRQGYNRPAHMRGASASHLSLIHIFTDVIELVPDEPASTGGKEHERIETKNNGDVYKRQPMHTAACSRPKGTNCARPGSEP